MKILISVGITWIFQISIFHVTGKPIFIGCSVSCQFQKIHWLSLFFLRGISFSGSVTLKWTQRAAELVTHRKPIGIVLKGAELCLLRLSRAGLWPQLSWLTAPVSDARYRPAPRSKGNFYKVIFFWLAVWTLSAISQLNYRIFQRRVFSAPSLWFLPVLAFQRKTHVNCAPKYEQVRHMRKLTKLPSLKIYIFYNGNKSDFIFTFNHPKSVRLKLNQLHILAEFSVGCMAVSYSLKKGIVAEGNPPDLKSFPEQF